MITLRRAQERGQADHGWLKSNHSFSFANYYDPKFMGFGPLRVINDDRLAPGRGFETHSHRDMEILSYVVEGSLEHLDSMGHGSVIRPGDLQVMSAGTGVSHSEFNASPVDGLRFLQIWIVPDEKSLQPSYDQKFYGDALRDDLTLVASPSGQDGSLKVHQDLNLYASLLSAGQRVDYSVNEQRSVWLQVVTGALTVGAETLYEGDGMALSGQQLIEISAITQANFLLFDLKEVG
jgi:hypothetical protein